MLWKNPISYNQTVKFKIEMLVFKGLSHRFGKCQMLYVIEKSIFRTLSNR